MRNREQRRQGERGSIIVLVAMSLVILIGIVGLAVDAGQLYAAKQHAQAAADAAAQAGAMDIYNGTNNGSATATSYAQKNGFASVTVSYPLCSALAWCNGHVTLSQTDTPNLIEVTVQRVVNTTLMQVLSVNASTVSATADAAIALSPSPIPILVLHPNLPGALSTNGGNTITICGGPARAFQVNSSSAASISVSGSGSVDLSHAGPLDPGDCSRGTGADFGNVGWQIPYPGSLLLGTKPGFYVSPASMIRDPLLAVAGPAQPAPNGSFVTYNTAATEAAHNCPVACRVYSPGYYDSGAGNGLSPTGFSVFRPGIYYINHGGFQLGSNTIVRVATAAVDETDPTGITNWTQGILIYNSPSAPVSAAQDIFSIASNSGKLPGNNTYPSAACPSGGNCLIGSPSSSGYVGILFFQNHATATLLHHSLSGGGGLSLTGTIYLSHTAVGIANDGTYQSLSLQGNSGGTTKVQGEIVVDVLSLGGTSGVTMNLISTPIFSVRQVALVK